MSKNVRDGSRSTLPVSEEEKILSNNVANLNLISTPKENNYVGISRNNPKRLNRAKEDRNKISTMNMDRNGFIRDSKHRMNIPEEPPEWKPPPDVLTALEKENIFPLKKKSTRFINAKYFCRSCEYHCDTVDVCIRHSQDSRHIHMKEAKLLDNVLKNLPAPTFDQTESITQLIQSVALTHGITDEETIIRKEIKNELEKLLLEVVPGAGLEISGSTLSGFGLKSSNLDLDVIVPEEIKPATALLAILKIIEKENRYSDYVNDLSSSFPCMTFTHKATGVCVVVGVSSPSARNTNILLGHYNSLDVRVKPLVTAFRFWAQLCQIDNQHRGTLPAHCFPLMVIHFLQHTTPPVLPVLHDLNSTTDPEHYLKPNEMDPTWKSSNRHSLGQLWIDLFYFYSTTFKMAIYTINVRAFEPVVRREKNLGKRMTIEDPFQIRRNLTRSVSSPSVFDYIVNRLKNTYQYFAIPQLEFGCLFKQVDSEQVKISSIDSLNTDEKAAIECLMSKDNSVERNDVEDEEISDDDDDDSTCEELEDFDELKNNDMKAQEDLEENSSSPVEETPSSNDSSVDEEIVPQLSDVKKTIERIPYKVAKKLMEQIKKEEYKYRFIERNFTYGKKVPLFCSACRKTGHDKSKCKEDELPPLKPLPFLKPHYLKKLSLIFQDLKNECAPTPKEIEDRDFIVSDLEAFIRLSFKGATLKLFGSSANGFGFGHSDLDICLTFEGHPTGENFNYIQVIEEITEKLKKFRPVHQVLAITTAKVPIVKFTVRTGRRMQLEADLSLYNTLALQNTQLLNTYSNIDPRVKVLGYAIKYFAKLCDMGDASRGSLSSYAYILMVIHFLQQCKPPVIPVLQKLYDPKKDPPEHCIDGWNTWFFSDIKNLPKYWKDFGKNKQNCGELWVNLLRYYTETFNWKEDVITIRQHEPLSRLMKLWTTQCIAIEDPFDLSHNLGAGLSRKMNTYIMKAFIRGREMFGSGYEAPPIGQGYRDLVEFMFDTHQLTDGAPPNDRGCRLCGKIGHIVKECPRKKQKRDPKKDVAKECKKKEDEKILTEDVKNEKERVLSYPDSTKSSMQDQILQSLPKDLVVTESVTQPKRNLEDGPLNASVSAIRDLKISGLDNQDMHMQHRPLSTPQQNFQSPDSSKTIDPHLLFFMANKFGRGAVHLPGSPPIVCSNIPLGSPVTPISSCSPPFFSHLTQIQKPNEVSSQNNTSLPNPPPGFTHSLSSPMQRSPLIHPSDNLSALRTVTTEPSSQAGNFPDSPNSSHPSITANAFDNLCHQKEPILQVLNAQQQQAINERHRQLFLQQQQIRFQEQLHYARMQEHQQYLFQLHQRQQMQMNMQPQQSSTKEVPIRHQFPNNHQLPSEQQTMDGNAFISHLMEQVSSRIVPQRMPGLPPPPPPPPPGLGPTTLPQMSFPLPTPYPNLSVHRQQQQFQSASQQPFPAFIPSEDSFQLRGKSCEEERRPFCDASPAEITKRNPAPDLMFLSQSLAASPPGTREIKSPTQENHLPLFSSELSFMENDPQ